MSIRLSCHYNVNEFRQVLKKQKSCIIKIQDTASMSQAKIHANFESINSSLLVELFYVLGNFDMLILILTIYVLISAHFNW